MTVSEAALAMGLSKTRVRQLLSGGVLEGEFHAPRTWFIGRESVERRVAEMAERERLGQLHEAPAEGR